MGGSSGFLGTWGERGQTRLTRGEGWVGHESREARETLRKLVSTEAWKLQFRGDRERMQIFVLGTAAELTKKNGQHWAQKI